MSDDEMLELSREILKLVEAGDGNPEVLAMRMQLMRLVAHVRDERRNETMMKEEITTINAALFGSRKLNGHAGVVNDMREIKLTQDRNRKMHATVLTGVVLLVIGEIWKVVAHLH